MKLYSIATGFFKLDGGAMFGVVPKSIWNKTNPADANNLCTWALRCLLIEDGKRLLLVDTGIGDKQDAKFFSHYYLHGDDTLDTSLARHGFHRDDITDVFLTHLHFDHCGGSIIRQGDQLVPAFRNAVYWSNEQHWQWATQPNDREKASFLKENILPIQASGRLQFIPSPSSFPAPGTPASATNISSTPVSPTTDPSSSSSPAPLPPTTASATNVPPTSPATNPFSPAAPTVNPSSIPAVAPVPAVASIPGAPPLLQTPLLPCMDIRFVYGHTDAMMLPQLRYKDRTIVYMADLLPSTGHLPTPYVMAYDMFPLKTLHEKAAFLTEAQRNEYVLFLEHDPVNECCDLQLTEKGIRTRQVFRLHEL